MKKTLLAIVISTLAAMSAHAQNFVSYDVGTVKDRDTDAKSSVQYLRASLATSETDSIRMLSRTQRYNADQFTVNALEVTYNKNIGLFNIGAGLGHDAGPAQTYKIVTAGYFLPVGESGAGAFTGVQYNWDKTKDHTIAWVGYSIPVSKSVTINPMFSRNYGDYHEDEITLGFAVNF